MKVLFRKKKISQSENPPETIYNNYADMMFRLCYRYIQKEEDAEEVMNDAFIKIFKAKDKFEEKFTGSFEAWMKKIMINEAISFIRRKGKFNQVDIDVQPDIESNISADEELTNEYYYKLIRLLPNGYRTVFNLFAVEGHSHKEIAELLGITESASRSQLAKARALLRKCLNEQEKVENGKYR